MPRSREEILVQDILDRLEGRHLTGQTRRLPGWATAAILGAGLSLSACSPPTQRPCEEDCNNINNNNNINNYNNINHPLYGINNINNTLYGIPDGGSDDADLDCPNCEYMAPLYSAPDDSGAGDSGAGDSGAGDSGAGDSGNDPVPLYGKK